MLKNDLFEPGLRNFSFHKKLSIYFFTLTVRQRLAHFLLPPAGDLHLLLHQSLLFLRHSNCWPIKRHSRYLAVVSSWIHLTTGQQRKRSTLCLEKGINHTNMRRQTKCLYCSVHKAVRKSLLKVRVTSSSFLLNENDPAKRSWLWF